MHKALQQIQSKKSLGQNFLNNPHVAKLVADAGEVSEGDTVFEIGPGTGMLTRELLRRGASVIAVEADERAVTALRETFSREIQAQKLTLFHGDVRDMDIERIGLTTQRFKIVANIPYYLTGILFRRFLASDIQPSRVVFLVQKEVAERVAKSKKESLLSLSVKVFGDPRYVKTVGRENFTPQPSVDSAIIAITNISRNRLGDISESLFFELIHHGFKSKRKQLVGNLSSSYSRAVLTHTFSTLGLLENVRGEDVSLSEWLNLCRALTVHSVSTKSS